MAQEKVRPKLAISLNASNDQQRDAIMLRRFDHEVKVLATLEHPGIARLYEAGTTATEEGSSSIIDTR